MYIFLTAIWLPHGQLWAIIEGTASFTRLSLRAYIFDVKVIGSLVTGWVPRLGQALSGVWTGNIPILIATPYPTKPRKIPLIKLYSLWKRKIYITHHRIYITHHRTPTGIYACILPHACWKPPERAWPPDNLKNYISWPLILADLKEEVQNANTEAVGNFLCEIKR